MPGEEVRANVRDDGGIEVWTSGWHVLFPADGAKPSARRDQAPTHATQPPGDVRIDYSSLGVGLRKGDWIVRVTHDSAPRIRNTKPRRRDIPRSYYYRTLNTFDDVDD